jgi:uncharacterized protein
VSKSASPPSADRPSASPPSASPPSADRPARMEPPVGAESAPYWEATREGRLLVQWCTACDRAIFYPRAFCPGCASSSLEWRTSSGRGSVYAAVVEHRPEAAGAAFSHGQPYCVALVDLDEGVRMLTNVVGCPPDEVYSGMAVTVTWEPLSDGRRLALFEPARRGAGGAGGGAGSETGGGAGSETGGGAGNRGGSGPA